MPTHQKLLRDNFVVERQAIKSHLILDHLTHPEDASTRERFEALARAIRDVITPRWLETEATYRNQNPKQIYYLSMEFLIGRMLVNNIVNLGLDETIRDSLSSDLLGDWEDLVDSEPDAGLGNGGLGRLAACFIESLATLQMPGMGYGLRYEYGIFRQSLDNGFQREQPDHWLQYDDPWEIKRCRESVQASWRCSFGLENGMLKVRHEQQTQLIGVPYDRPVVGYGGKSINTLRLWSAASPDYFDFQEFGTGDFVGAMLDRTVAETITRVLYPDDSTTAGQALRFLQEHFLVTCSLADIIRKYRRENLDWSMLPTRVAIQMNDTHPAMAVAELMRILLDVAKLGWEQSWELTTSTLAYTNHTLLPEALEKWPVRLFEAVCPRLLEIIYEINHRFLSDVSEKHQNDVLKMETMSLLEEKPIRQVRMAHLAIVGSHSVNGVAKIHSDLLKTRVVSDFAEMFPHRFNNKTNGITPRRWLLVANPELSKLITDVMGDGWITDADQLQELSLLAEDSPFQEAFRACRRTNKERLAAWLQSTTDHRIDVDSIFDFQIKRIHEYKRQLLNILHVIWLYQRMRDDSSFTVPPRTILFAGKAAPAYQLAKLIIKLINNVGKMIDEEPATKGRLKVVFVPDYKVSVAERIIPACDLSEQISTAGFEASGTGNMKFMMNGALTIGTRDGATIEMAEEACEDHFFLFGLTADEVSSSRVWYSPRWHYENDLRVRTVLDLIRDDHFSPQESGLFIPIVETLLTSDYFMHLADFGSYVEAQERVSREYQNENEWTRKAILNMAASGHFSSDRVIREYARDIWEVHPCPVNEKGASQ
ncbi:glycogen/starch/alpha-glucan phosphorylase [Lacunimicrobium album]